MTGRQDVFQQAMSQGHTTAWDLQWDKAADWYRQALEELPDHPQALTNLGLALFELQDYEAALNAYQHAAKVTPEDPIPVEKAAQMLDCLHRPEQASQAALQAAELYLKSQDVKKAIENWQRAIHWCPTNLRAHSRLALVYERIGEKQKAVAQYISLAGMLQAAGDIGKAIQTINQALRIIPFHADAVEALAMLRDSKPIPFSTRPGNEGAPVKKNFAAGADPQGLSRSQALIQPETGTDPIAEAQEQAVSTLAQILFEEADESQDETESRHSLQTILKGGDASQKQNDRPQLIYHLRQVVLLQTNGQFAQAAQELEQAMEAGLEHTGANFNLGFLYTQTDQLESAVRQLQTAAGHNDYALGARLLMGDVLRKLGNLKAASIEYLEALKLADTRMEDPAHEDELSQIYDSLIEIYRQDEDAEAQKRICENVAGLLVRPGWKEHLRSARDQLKSDAIAWDESGLAVPLAEILSQASGSQIVESIKHIQEIAEHGDLRTSMEEAFYALRYAPSYLPLHKFMGEILLRQERVPEAITKFMVVARAYSVRGDPRRAMELYRRVIELGPMDLNARISLIDQLISIGQMAQAIQQYFDLADVYYHLADLEKAHKTYAKALEISQKSGLDSSWRVKILYRMADIDLQSLEWRKALRIFEQIRKLQPDDEKCRMQIIELNLHLGQENVALAELDHYVAQLEKAGLRTRAIAFLDGLVKENPGQVQMRKRLARLYNLEGQLKDAIIALDAAGRASLEKGDRKAAAEVVEAILALNPPNKARYQNLLIQLRGR